MAISFSLTTSLQIEQTLTVSSLASSMLRVDANGVVSTTTLQSNFSLSGGTLSLASALTSINSVTSAAGQNLVLGLGSGGAALTLASSTLAATFAGNVIVSGGTITGPSGTGGLTLVTPSTTGPLIFPQDGAAPATSGSTKAGFFRQYQLGGSRALDSGISGSGAWLQSRDINDYSVNYPLLLNPNGGTVSVPSTTASSSTTTGALVVGGGIGVAGTGYFGSTLTVTGGGASITGATTTIASSGAGTAALLLTGNDQSNTRVRITNSGSGGSDISMMVGNPGASNAGWALYDNTAAVRLLYVVNSSGDIHTPGVINKTNSAATTSQFLGVTGSTTAATYALITNTSGGLAFGVMDSVGNTILTNGTSYAAAIYSTTANPLLLGVNTTVAVTVASTGTSIAATTASTSTTTGALVVGGGVGAAGAGWFGGNVNIPNAFYFTTKTAGGTTVTILGMTAADKVALDPNGYGVLVGNTLVAAGAISTTATTASTSTTTGSLINAGGFGNAGSAYIGGLLNVSGASITAEGYLVTRGNLQFVTPPGDASAVQANTLGWNRSGGRGEFDLINAKGPGASGGFTFYQWNGSSETVLLDIAGTSGAITLGSASSITAASATDLTLAGGSSGASLVLGSGGSATATLTLGAALGTEISGLAIYAPLANGYGSGINFQSNLAGGGAATGARVSMTGADSWAGAATQSSHLDFWTIGAGTLSRNMRLAHTGNLLVGTTSDGGARLNVAGTGFVAAFRGNGSDVYWQLINDATDAHDWQFTAGKGSGDGDGFIIRDSTAGARRLLIDESGRISIFSTENATNTTTGALRVAGGVGVVGSAYIGGNVLNVTSATTNGTQLDVGNTDTGGITYSWVSTGSAWGGGGQAGRFYLYHSTAGELLNVNNSRLHVQLATASTSTTTGALVVSGGAGFSGSVFMGGDSTLVTTSAGVFTLKRSNDNAANTAINFVGADDVVDWQIGTNRNVGLGFEINEGSTNRLYIAPTSGVVSVTSTTASTSTTTGALTVAGGAGFSGAIWSGDSLNVQSSGSSLLKLINTSGGGATWVVNSFNDGDLYVSEQGVQNWLKLSKTTGLLTLLGGITAGGDLTVSGGNVGVGVASQSQTAIDIQSSLSGSVNQWGILSRATFGSDGTGVVAAYYAKVNTAAASYTLTQGSGLYVESPALGAGSAVTSIYGVRIQNQGASGITNAYGLHIGAQSGSSANWAIYTAGAGDIFFGATTDATTGGTGAVQLAGGLYVTKSIVGGGGRIMKTSVVTSTTTLDSTYHVVVGNHATVAFTINLPAAPSTGQSFVVKNKGAANVTLAGNGANIFTTAAAASITLYTGDCYAVTYDGAVWAAV